jgi:calcineurin-like phosphoesterase family protein
MIKIDLQKGQNIWVTSDTHFNHKNICRSVTNWRTQDGEVPDSQTRDFKTLELMNEAIVNNINFNVGQDDILIHLGDWSFGGFEIIEVFRNRIICQNIHLILGNHDHHIERNRGDIQQLFSSVNTLEQFDLKWEGGKETFTICHYPLASWNNMNNGVIHLHGHVHLPTDKRFGKGKKMDAGMDGHPEFRPYNIIREIIPLMKKREIKSDMLYDHHEERFEGQDVG